MADWHYSDLSRLSHPAANVHVPLLDPNDLTTPPAGPYGSNKWTYPGDLVAAALGIVWPSGDTSGVTDTAAIQGLLNAGTPVHLAAGTFYVNAVLEFGDGAVITGQGRGNLGSDAQTTIKAVTAMNAVLATKGWNASTNTTVYSGGLFRDFCIDGNSLAVNGLVLQQWDTVVENVMVRRVSSAAFRPTSLGQNGTTAITNTLVNNHFTRCVVDTAGNGFYAEDQSGSSHNTDGWITDCVVAGASNNGIKIDQAAGWRVTGNHLYGLAADAIFCTKAWATEISGNYIETWGTSTASGFYHGIYATVDGTPGVVITGSRVEMFGSAGNAASTIRGIYVSTVSSTSTGRAVVCGNQVQASVAPTAGAALQYNNTGPSSSLTVASTGNLLYNFPTLLSQSPNGGTLTVTAGS